MSAAREQIYTLLAVNLHVALMSHRHHTCENVTIMNSEINPACTQIRYDIIEEFNVDSIADHSA